jgi:hypothetical protein
MKKSILTLSVGLASLLAANAFAQSRGETDPEQSRAAPSKRVSKEDKAAARQERIANGKDAAKAASPADDLPPAGPAKAKAATKEERKSAAAARKQETIEAVKKGETTKGER